MELQEKIDEALGEILRGCEEVVDKKKLEALVQNYFENNETYTVKAGFDPTAPDLHLGHTVLLQKLATFQKFGGVIKFLIGDFTAMIGDPTGKSETRKALTREEVLVNSKSYEEQVFKILDSQKMDIVFNSAWLDKLGADGLIVLTRDFLM